MLVGENLATYHRGEEGNAFTLHVDVDAQLPVAEGDYIGWHTEGAPMVAYAKQKKGLGVLIQTVRKPVASGETVDWAAVKGSEPRDYAVQAVVTKGSKLKFQNLDSDVDAPYSPRVGQEIYRLTLQGTSGVDIPPHYTVFMHSSSTYFAYNASLNSVYIKEIPPKGKHELEFTVRDHCGNEDKGKLKVSVDRKWPAISNLPAVVSIREDIRNKEVEMFKLDIINSGPIGCRLKGADPSIGKKQFILRTLNDTTVLYLKSTAELRYQEINEYELSINCKEGKDSVTESLFVDVVPNSVPFIFNLPSNVSIVANSSMEGDVVYMLNATDVEGDAMTFNVTCEQKFCPFGVEQSAVVISQDLRLSDTDTFIVKVSVGDSYNKGKAGILVVTLTGLNTPPYIINIPDHLKLSVEENQPPGAELYHVMAADQNADDVLRFSLLLKPTYMAKYFLINELNGVINITSPVNFERLPSKNIKFTVYVTDGFHITEAKFKVMVIDINEAPYFQYQNYTIYTSEGKAGDVVDKDTIVATDEDKKDYASYGLDCGPDNYFLRMDQKKADYVMTQEYELDVDARHVDNWVIHCDVTATDRSDLVSHANLEVIVSDEDDNDPLFEASSYLFAATRDLPVFTVLGSAVARDKDTAFMNSRIFYSFTEDTYDFVIDNNGTIYLIADLSDVAVGTLYRLTLNARDDHGATHSVPLTVVVLAGDHASLLQALKAETLTFFDYPGNVAWFVTAMYLVLVISVLILYLIDRQVKFTFKLRTWDGRRISPSVWNDFSNHSADKTSVISVRPAATIGEVVDLSTSPKMMNASNESRADTHRMSGVSRASVARRRSTRTETPLSASTLAEDVIQTDRSAATSSVGDRSSGADTRLVSAGADTRLVSAVADTRMVSAGADTYTRLVSASMSHRSEAISRSVGNSSDNQTSKTFTPLQTSPLSNMSGRSADTSRNTSHSPSSPASVTSLTTSRVAKNRTVVRSTVSRKQSTVAESASVNHSTATYKQIGSPTENSHQSLSRLTTGASADCPPVTRRDTDVSSAYILQHDKTGTRASDANMLDGCDDRLESRFSIVLSHQLPVTSTPNTTPFADIRATADQPHTEQSRTGQVSGSPWKPWGAHDFQKRNQNAATNTFNTTRSSAKSIINRRKSLNF